MAKILRFDLESLLKHGTIKRDHEEDVFAIFNKSGDLLALIVGEVLVANVLQIKLNTRDMELVKQYTKDLEVPSEGV